LAVTCFGTFLHQWLPINSVITAAGTAFVSVAAVGLVGFLLGIRMKDLREEALVLRGMFGGK
jgi:hypothetical protein